MKTYGNQCAWTKRMGSYHCHIVVMGHKYQRDTIFIHPAHHPTFHFDLATIFSMAKNTNFSLFSSMILFCVINQPIQLISQSINQSRHFIPLFRCGYLRDDGGGGDGVYRDAVCDDAAAVSARRYLLHRRRIHDVHDPLQRGHHAGRVHR